MTSPPFLDQIIYFVRPPVRLFGFSYRAKALTAPKRTNEPQSGLFSTVSLNKNKKRLRLPVLKPDPSTKHQHSLTEASDVTSW